MISIQEAIDISLQKTEVSQKTEISKLADALGHKLAENIYSKMDMPPFPQSAMDGYALKIHDKNVYTIIAEQKAGDGNDFKLEAGEAIRIFTGAMLPKSADSIVIQEKAIRKADLLYLESKAKLGSNIRPQAEQIKKGELALEKNFMLNPASIGYIASLGISEVKVWAKPKVGIISTGNELVSPGNKLKPGQIYESNQLMLTSALREKGIHNVISYKVKDNLKATEFLIEKALEECDYLLISGGISVGDYDFVAKALHTNKVDCHFYKVAQKPGKPIWFGSKNGKLVFALPGNPAAALSCFYVYVLPSIKKWQGLKDYKIKWGKSLLKEAYFKKGIRPQFLKAKTNDKEIEILDGQNSSMLASFSMANALCFLDGKEEYWAEKGSAVNYLKINE